MASVLPRSKSRYMLPEKIPLHCKRRKSGQIHHWDVTNHFLHSLHSLVQKTDKGHQHIEGVGPGFVAIVGDDEMWLFGRPSLACSMVTFTTTQS